MMEHARLCADYLPSYNVLGIRLRATQISSVISQMEIWISECQYGNSINFANVHVVMEAQKNRRFMEILNSAALTVPDGKPLIWMARASGFKLQRRVYGPDLMADFFAATQGKHYRHFLYGGAPGVAERLADNFRKKFEGMQIVGTHSPPFRVLTPSEDDEVVSMINEARPDVLWVGLGCPKQEYWVHEHRTRLRVPVLAAVGQAFDIYAGAACQAPAFMREHGLEWLFRLLHDPRRLWRRYLVYNPQFVYYALLQTLGLKTFDNPA